MSFVGIRLTGIVLVLSILCVKVPTVSAQEQPEQGVVQQALDSLLPDSDSQPAAPNSSPAPQTTPSASVEPQPTPAPSPVPTPLATVRPSPQPTVTVTPRPTATPIVSIDLTGMATPKPPSISKVEEKKEEKKEDKKEESREQLSKPSPTPTQMTSSVAPTPQPPPDPPGPEEVAGEVVRALTRGNFGVPPLFPRETVEGLYRASPVSATTTSALAAVSIVGLGAGSVFGREALLQLLRKILNI